MTNSDPMTSPLNHNRTQLPSADLVLVSCVKTKQKRSAQAKDLYISDFFKKQRAYAELRGLPWYILSSEYGLVHPEKVIEPYERFLPKEPISYRRQWGTKVVEELTRVLGSLDGQVIEVHANAEYINSIRVGLSSRGAILSNPLEGLRLGEKSQWYKRILAEASN